MSKVGRRINPFNESEEIKIKETIPTKKKVRNSILIKDKIKILEYAKKSSVAQASSYFRVNNSMIYRWRKQEEELRKKLQHDEKKYTLHSGGSTVLGQELEEYLLNWVIKMKDIRVEVSNNLLKEEALRIAKEYQISDFCASHGWIQKFKFRHHMYFEEGRNRDLKMEIDYVLN